MNHKSVDTPIRDAEPNDWSEVVREKVNHLRYGSVVVTVHDGYVTQVESIEKTRITPARVNATASPST